MVKNQPVTSTVTSFLSLSFNLCYNNDKKAGLFMSEFSNYFKECIHTNHINVSLLARQSGIHRTLLQKIMTGARLPSDETFFEKVLPYMMLSLRQQEDLMSLYNIEKIGKEHYYQHMIVKSFIEHLQVRSHIESPMLKLEIESQPKKDTYCVHDRFSLIQCISSALGRVKVSKDPKVYLLMQDADPSIYDFIASALYGRSDVRFTHLLCFQSAELTSPKQLQFNIRLCESITPMLLCGCDYHPMCYYHSNAEDQSYYAPYPYVFLTEDCVINIQKDLSGAIIDHEPSILNQFQEFIDKRMAISIPIIRQYQQPAEILMPYLQELSKTPSTDTVYSFMQEPCILPLFPVELTLNKLKKEIKQDTIMMDMLKKYLEMVHDHDQLIIFFTKAGLYRLMDTGRISEVPHHLYEPFTMEERLLVLKALITEQKKGSYHAYMINDKFSFHQDLSISVYSENRIIFRYGIDADGSSFLLNELSFGTILVDFFRYLPNSDMVEKQADTMLFLEHVYRQYAKHPNV